MTWVAPHWHSRWEVKTIYHLALMRSSCLLEKPSCIGTVWHSCRTITSNFGENSSVKFNRATELTLQSSVGKWIWPLRSCHVMRSGSMAWRRNGHLSPRYMALCSFSCPFYCSCIAMMLLRHFPQHPLCCTKECWITIENEYMSGHDDAIDFILGFLAQEVFFIPASSCFLQQILHDFSTKASCKARRLALRPQVRIAETGRCTVFRILTFTREHAGRLNADCSSHMACDADEVVCTGIMEKEWFRIFSK